MNDLRVYWRPGCSSCVKVKEFLTNLGVEFESVNVSARPEAMDELRELGVRTVPVVARGKEYVFAQELADVSRFIGRDVQFRRLPAAALMQKWLNVLEAVAAQSNNSRADGAGENVFVFFIALSVSTAASRGHAFGTVAGRLRAHSTAMPSISTFAPSSSKLLTSTSVIAG